MAAKPRYFQAKSACFSLCLYLDVFKCQFYDSEGILRIFPNQIYHVKWKLTTTLGGNSKKRYFDLRWNFESLLFSEKQDLESKERIKHTYFKVIQTCKPRFFFKCRHDFITYIHTSNVKWEKLKNKNVRIERFPYPQLAMITPWITLTSMLKLKS